VHHRHDLFMDTDARFVIGVEELYIFVA